ncbi:MAG TPA: V-type ATPase 116kDa subunit family protein [Acidimicrobiales bacterium]|nr:V-type ATPase 116kDa subunit family protein [Acidimicrobiales bacterium]
MAPSEVFRRALVATANAGLAELETGGADGSAGDMPTRDIASRNMPAPGGTAFDAELETRARAAVSRGAVTATAGWVPTDDLAHLQARLAPLGAAAVPLPSPPGADPPTLLDGGRVSRSFRPLVELYTTVPYRDVDPSAAAGVVYVLMFGMMFGDVGHGAVLLAAGLALRAGRPHWVTRWRRLWPFVTGAGAAACAFGFAYGEAFGPTGLPAAWLAPLDRPTTLLAAAVGIGAVLLGLAYAVGSVNRWREGGPGRAAVAASGGAGSALYAGLAMAGGGWYLHQPALGAAGAVLAVGGLTLIGAGLLAGAGRGATRIMEVSVELFDTVVRLGSNAISFARLAAFGLTHAALGGIVWSATTGLWHHGPAVRPLAAAVFVAGNAVAFALEALVAGVQALRLEYYELFSRVFAGQGRPFRPWRHPTVPPEEAPCPGS